MTYLHWLIIVSLAFVAIERWIPARRDQSMMRTGWLRDLGFLFINGHLFGMVVAGWSTAWAHATTDWLDGANFDLAVAREWPIWLQCVVFFVLSDLLQWLGHNALHRVPWLWRFHRVHHAIHEMDWAGNFRYHWLENVVYRIVQFVPLTALGASYEATFIVYVFGTAWGHFNHANVAIDIGWLRYLFNSPSMHLWHHDASSEGGPAKNFGIVLSLWDWLFGTAYWPRHRQPNRLGYPGDSEMPESLVGELTWPISGWVRPTNPPDTAARG